MNIRGLLYDVEHENDEENKIILYGNDLFLQYFYLDYSKNPELSEVIP